MPKASELKQNSVGYLNLARKGDAASVINLNRQQIQFTSVGMSWNTNIVLLIVLSKNFKQDVGMPQDLLNTVRVS